MGFPAHSLSPSDRAALVSAEHEGSTFLAYRDGFGDLRLAPIERFTRVTIGRTPDNDVVIDGDPQVSRAHAVLERGGGGWSLVDAGLSRNGSFVNGERVTGHRRLADDDMLRLGTTSILFRCPAPGADSTIAGSSASAARLTDAEHRVLVALCRPLLAPGTVAGPASNQEIADELVLSVSGVKAHLRSVSAKLGVADLPQNRKRAVLAHRALESGLVTSRDLR